MGRAVEQPPRKRREDLRLWSGRAPPRPRTLSHVQIRHLTENTRASGEQRTHSDWLMTGQSADLVS